MGAYNGLAYGKNVVFIPQQMTLYAQHLGADSHTLPDGTTTKYVLTRNLLPSDNYESEDYLNVSVTSTSETLVINQRFYWWEDVVGDMYLLGDFVPKARFGIAGDGTNAIYLTKVAFDIEALDSGGTHSTVGSKTITFSTPRSTSSTAFDVFNVMGIIKAGFQRFRMYKDLVLRVRAWGYIAAGTGNMRLYFSRGEDATYVIVNYEEG